MISSAIFTEYARWFISLSEPQSIYIYISGSNYRIEGEKMLLELWKMAGIRSGDVLEDCTSCATTVYGECKDGCAVACKNSCTGAVKMF